MDPLSITASLVAVIGAASTVTKQLKSLLKNWRDAPETVCALVDEVSHLNLVLEACKNSVNEVYEITDLHWHAVLPQASLILSKVDIQLTELGELVSSCFIPSKAGEAVQTFHINRWKWLHTVQKRVTEIHMEIQKSKEDIMIVLDTVGISTTAGLHSSVQSISLDMRQCQVILQQQHEVILRQLEPLQAIQLQLERSQAPMTLPNENQSDVLESWQHGLHIHPTTHTFFGALTDEISTSYMPSQLIADQVFCKPWCSCSCHSRKRYQTPEALQAFLGRLSISCRGFPWPVSSCSEPGCKKRSNSRLHFSFQFPQWCVSKVFNISFRGNILGDPELLLRVRRVVPNNTAAICDANMGRLTHLKELFMLGQASPYDEDPGGHSILARAIVGNQPEVALFLLSCGAELDHENRFGISPQDGIVGWVLGSSSQRARWIQFAASCNLDHYGFSTVHKIVLGLIAIDLKEQLASSTAELNARDRNGRTPLFWAARRGDIHALSILLSYQADLNISDDLAETPLHAAATFGHVHSAFMLIENGINLETKNHDGRTALRLAAQSRLMEDDGKECEMIKLLLQYKAEVNCPDFYGETPLIGAAVANRQGRVQFLLENGAVINAVDKNGLTALIYSIQYGNWSLVELFLASGADYRTIDKHGNSILHQAAHFASHDVLDKISLARVRNIDVDRLNSGGWTAEEVAEQVRRDVVWREEQDWHDKFTLLISMIRHDTEISQGRALEAAIAIESAESGGYLDSLAALFEGTEANQRSDKAGSTLDNLLDDEDEVDELFYDAEE